MPSGQAVIESGMQDVGSIGQFVVLLGHLVDAFGQTVSVPVPSGHVVAWAAMEALQWVGRFGQAVSTYGHAVCAPGRIVAAPSGHPVATANKSNEGTPIALPTWSITVQAVAEAVHIVACSGHAVTRTGHTVICVHAVWSPLQRVSRAGQLVNALGHSVTFLGHSVGVFVPSEQIVAAEVVAEHFVGTHGHSVLLPPQTVSAPTGHRV